MRRRLVYFCLGGVVALLVGTLLALWLWRPDPSAKTRVVQVDREAARLVHKSVYAQQTLTIHITGKEARVFGVIQAERLVIASGTCSAGVDHDQTPPDIYEYQGTMHVILAEPTILDCGLGSVTSFDGGGIIPASTDLSNRLHEEAVKELQQQAEQSDLVAKARENAIIQVELFLRRLGFQQVLITFKKP